MYTAFCVRFQLPLSKLAVGLYYACGFFLCKGCDRVSGISKSERKSKGKHWLKETGFKVVSVFFFGARSTQTFLGDRFVREKKPICLPSRGALNVSCSLNLSPSTGLPSVNEPSCVNHSQDGTPDSRSDLLPGQGSLLPSGQDLPWRPPSQHYDSRQISHHEKHNRLPSDAIRIRPQQLTSPPLRPKSKNIAAPSKSAPAKPLSTLAFTTKNFPSHLLATDAGP